MYKIEKITYDFLSLKYYSRKNNKYFERFFNRYIKGAKGLTVDNVKELIIKYHVPEEFFVYSSYQGDPFYEISIYLPIQFIKDNPNIEIDPILISLNKNLTWDYVVEKGFGYWDFTRLSSNDVVTSEIVLNNLDLPWDYQYLSLNSNVNQELVTSTLDKDWDIALLSHNKNIVTYDFINSHLDWKWDINALSCTVEERLIEEHPDWKWEIDNISFNPNITEDFVRRHIDWKWEYSLLARNKNISIDFILEHSNTSQIYGNPSIRIDHLKERKINEYILCYNPSLTQEMIDSINKWDELIPDLSTNDNIKIIFHALLDDDVFVSVGNNIYKCNIKKIISMRGNLYTISVTDEFKEELKQKVNSITIRS